MRWPVAAAYGLHEGVETQLIGPAVKYYYVARQLPYPLTRQRET